VVSRLENNKDIAILPANYCAVFSAGDNSFVLMPDGRIVDSNQFTWDRDLGEISRSRISLPDGTSKTEILNELLHWRDRSDALTFFLASLDANLSFDLRTRAASFVDHLLANEKVRDFIITAVLSEKFQPTPTAQLQSNFPRLNGYTDLVKLAIKYQPAIVEFWNSWAQVCASFELPVEEEIDSLKRQILATGTVRQLVEAISAES
jgi:hypothetical protein